MQSLKEARRTDSSVDEKCYEHRRHRLSKPKGQRLACTEEVCRRTLGKEEKSYSGKFVRGCFLPLELFVEEASLHDKCSHKAELKDHIIDFVTEAEKEKFEGFKKRFHKTYPDEAEE